MKEYKLCYVSNGKAYFTTQDIEKQWGDDWNDRPYEHNAGTPYEYREGEKESNTMTLKEPWDIYAVHYEVCLITPDDGHSNSDYSVMDINKGQIAWLRSYEYEKNPVRIFAGTTLGEFKSIIKKLKGRIYEEVK